MLRPLGSSLSGITSSFRILNAASSNIANAQTQGYKTKTVTLSESSAGGVTAVTSICNSPGPRLELDGKMFEGSNVDIASEMVSLITARRIFSFNAAAFKTAVEMEKSIIDTIA